MSHNTMEELNPPATSLKDTDMKSFLNMIEDASMYRDATGQMFRIDWVDRDAEGFHVTNEVTDVTTFVAACDVPEAGRFYNLVELNEQDYED